MKTPRIIKLTAENVKKLSLVEISPEGNLVVVGGKNGQGKSSVLDSIMYALGGADILPTKPVRRGEDTAKVELDLGDIVVKRTFTASGGGSLTVTDKDQNKMRSPQAILDALVGKISFDPLAFARSSQDDQSETLQALLGLSFEGQDAEIAKIFNERTAINRELNSIKARLQAAPEHEGVDGEESSTEEILARQEKALKQNETNRQIRDKLKVVKSDLLIAETAAQNIGEDIARLQRELDVKKNRLKQTEESVAKAKAQVEQATEQTAKLVDVDVAEFKTMLAGVEVHNRKVRENKVKAQLRADYGNKNKESENLTSKIQALERQKRKSVQDAKFPVAGLGLSDTREVTYNDLPFTQASTSEQLRVSIAIGLALNKNLKVLLIRPGSELDQESLGLVAQMAAEADAQVWLESSRPDHPTSVVMEDGHVRLTEKAE